MLSRNKLWSIGVYCLNRDFNLRNSLYNLCALFNTRKLRLKKGHVHTLADPFLIENQDNLYLFYESQMIGEEGKIKVLKTNDLEKWEDLGVVLEEQFHLSYPFVFQHNAKYYCIPETEANSEVALYRFDNFPRQLSKSHTLVKGEFADSSCHYFNGLWYLFTSSASGLHIFMSPDLFSSSWQPHPKNPVCKNPKYSRCGGGLYFYKDQIYRFAQDCEKEYGSQLHILLVTRLSETEYSEELFNEDFLSRKEPWNNQGGHHLSLCNFKGQLIAAVDGKQNDFYFNKLISIFFKFFR